MDLVVAHTFNLLGNMSSDWNAFHTERSSTRAVQSCSLSFQYKSRWFGIIVMIIIVTVLFEI